MVSVPGAVHIPAEGKRIADDREVAQRRAAASHHPAEDGAAGAVAHRQVIITAHRAGEMDFAVSGGKRIVAAEGDGAGVGLVATGGDVAVDRAGRALTASMWWSARAAAHRCGEGRRAAAGTIARLCPPSMVLPLNMVVPELLLTVLSACRA